MLSGEQDIFFAEVRKKFSMNKFHMKFYSTPLYLAWINAMTKIDDCRVLACYGKLLHE